MSSFSAGPNIALKIPKNKFEQTVAFYRDVLKFEVVERDITHPTVSRTFEVTFGSNTIWLDCVDNYAKSDIWLELQTDNVAQATAYLDQHGVPTCDELEQIPENRHWIQDPAGNVLIIGPNSQANAHS